MAMESKGLKTWGAGSPRWKSGVTGKVPNPSNNTLTDVKPKPSVKKATPKATVKKAAAKPTTKPAVKKPAAKPTVTTKPKPKGLNDYLDQGKTPPSRNRKLPSDADVILKGYNDKKTVAKLKAKGIK